MSNLIKEPPDPSPLIDAAITSMEEVRQSQTRWLDCVAQWRSYCEETSAYYSRIIDVLKHEVKILEIKNEVLEKTLDKLHRANTKTD